MTDANEAVARLRALLSSTAPWRDVSARWPIIHADVALVLDALDRAQAALTKIVTEQGRVCEDFELCDHIACRSSCASWFIADRVLKPWVYEGETQP